MNLDLDTLREMISSTLQEITTESLESTEAEKNAVDALEALKDDTEKEEAEIAKAQADEEMKEKSSQEPEEPVSLEESFQITKGRLRQIIAEELVSAKKQGIL